MILWALELLIQLDFLRNNMVPTTTITRLLGAAAVAWILPSVAATGAFINQNDRGITTVKSPINDEITISYKEPTGACTTALEDQRQITGWVNVPGDYPINLFFWFVEARQETDLLSVWLNGGPGSSSMFGFFTGAGPCEVVEDGRSLTTKAREWGWDRSSNMLFIDQPNQVGFSYDVPTNGTFYLWEPAEPPIVPPVSEDELLYGHEWSVFNGTFSSNNEEATANTTANAAEAIYHLMQGFLATFPEYNPPDNQALGINLFAESYGGKYAPIYADKWDEMNEARDNGRLSKDSTIEIDLRSVGIVNGCIDDLIMGPSYAEFLYNSSGYNTQFISKAMYEDTLALFEGEGGCKEAIIACRNASNTLDPDESGDSARANSLCSHAVDTCNEALFYVYLDIEPLPSFYDIAAPYLNPFPPAWYHEYVTSTDFIANIGAATNFSQSSMTVYSEFRQTGDWELTETIPKLAKLLDKGIRVSLLYGDRDFICNWVGGEAASLAVADAAGDAYNDGKFAAAGYAEIEATPDGYIGGAVRQLGNLSFARVYQAGHALPSYQPETSFQLFSRIILGTDLATGQKVDLSTFVSQGSPAANKVLEIPNHPEPICWLRALKDTCTNDHIMAISIKDGVIINGVHYFNDSEWSGGELASTNEDTSSWTGGIYTSTSEPANENGDNSNNENDENGKNNENSSNSLTMSCSPLLASLAISVGFFVGGLLFEL